MQLDPRWNIENKLRRTRTTAGGCGVQIRPAVTKNGAGSTIRFRWPGAREGPPLAPMRRQGFVHRHTLRTEEIVRSGGVLLSVPREQPGISSGDERTHLYDSVVHQSRTSFEGWHWLYTEVGNFCWMQQWSRLETPQAPAWARRRAQPVSWAGANRWRDTFPLWWEILEIRPIFRFGAGAIPGAMAHGVGPTGKRAARWWRCENSSSGRLGKPTMENEAKDLARAPCCWDSTLHFRRPAGQEKRWF